MKIIKRRAARRSPRSTATSAASEITSDEGEFTIEDLIAEEDMVDHHLALGLHQAHVGLDVPQAAARRARAQRRRTLKDEDFIEQLFIGSTHDYILVLHR